MQQLNISWLEPLFMKTYFYHNLIFYFCTKFYACWRMYKKIHKKWKIYLIFIFIICMFSFSCRRCSSVVEHVIGNDGVASPILASGTIKKPSFMEGFLMVIGRGQTCEATSGAGSWWKRVLNLANSLVKYEVWTLRRERDPLLLSNGNLHSCQPHHF